ncbi:MAG: transporter substrate-binding domain-containing protein, partial [Anaerolineales bacterium]
MRNKWIILFVMLLSVVLIAACGSSEPAPPEAEVPTEAAPDGDSSWAQIESSGMMRVGTAADYAPYEYYVSIDDTPEIDGFDVALIKEVGAKLGVSVEVVDFAFQGLGGALQIGQIDAAIAAISVTEERQAEFDFSNVYFSGVGVALAADGSTLESIDTPEEMAGKRVGVQETTVYETWAQDELVDTGIITTDQLFVYAKPEHAVGDLELDRLDIVLMDKLPAEEYVNAGGVKIVGEGVNPQLYAIGLQNGASELQAKINEALTELQNEGVVSTLAMEYLGVVPDGSLPPTTPEATSTPGPTPTPSGCLDGMAFVEDLSISDGEKMPPSTSFTKGWLIKNVGTCTWEETYSMKYVYGNNHFGNKEEFVGKKVLPGDLFEMYMNMKSPPNPGEYAGFYQMHNTGGFAFGETVWVAIQVVTSSGATSTPAPVPTATSTTEPG